jgi:hypothetical protein
VPFEVGEVSLREGFAFCDIAPLTTGHPLHARSEGKRRGSQTSVSRSAPG